MQVATMDAFDNRKKFKISVKIYNPTVLFAILPPIELNISIIKPQGSVLQT